MGIDRKTLKRQAREAMGLPRPGFRTVTLVYILMTSGVSILFSLIPLPAGSDYAPGTATIFLSLFLFLYDTVVDFGYTLWALWANRRLNPGPGALLQGFSVAGRVILMRLLILLRTTGAPAREAGVLLRTMAASGKFRTAPPAEEALRGCLQLRAQFRTLTGFPFQRDPSLHRNPAAKIAIIPLFRC